MTEKHKTSINIDPHLWTEWNHFVLDKTGSTRKVSEETENALREYMDRHRRKATKGSS